MSSTLVQFQSLAYYDESKGINIGSGPVVLMKSDIVGFGTGCVFDRIDYRYTSRLHGVIYLKSGMKVEVNENPEQVVKKMLEAGFGTKSVKGGKASETISPSAHD